MKITRIDKWQLSRKGPLLSCCSNITSKKIFLLLNCLNKSITLYWKYFGRFGVIGLIRIIFFSDIFYWSCLRANYVDDYHKLNIYLFIEQWVVRFLESVKKYHLRRSFPFECLSMTKNPLKTTRSELIDRKLYKKSEIFRPSNSS